MIDLPIDSAIDRIRGALDTARAVVVVAAPGAGKTTRVPPALVGDGAVILLQPRRAAARSIARRIAEERGWTVGGEIGWQMRFDTRVSAATRLVVATEGVLTARLQQDPLLSTFRTIILDEFHERSVHADLGLALARQAWVARGDLRIVVMSATLDAGGVSAFLGGCPVIEVGGRMFPIEIEYAHGSSVAASASQLLASTPGSVLCFLPGAFEIETAAAELRRQLDGTADVLALHGALDSAEQDRALFPSRSRRVIVATNIAETSVTVPDVTAVVDSGLHKVARYDAERGIDSLTTERISQDSADQRAGRAGRVAPGRVVRLWSHLDRLRPHREPDIARIDLAGVTLDVAAWGSDPRQFEWFEAPDGAALEKAIALLERLGAFAGGAITAAGRQMQTLGLPPRLARILIAGGGARPLARACALLSERAFVPPRSVTTSSDLLSALDDWPRLPVHVRRAGELIETLAERALGKRGASDLSDEQFRQALLAGYPDRVARRREPRSSRLQLASGTGAVLAPESGVRDGEFLVALDVRASPRPDDPESRVRLASRVEREWLTPTARETVHRVDDGGVVRAADVRRYDSLVLSETHRPADPAIAAPLLAQAFLARGLNDDDRRLIRRIAFSGRAIDLEALAATAAFGAASAADISLAHALPRDVAAALERDAPDRLPLPSGRTARLEYDEDGGVSASVKLQELFGLARTPAIGPRRVPVTFALLAPSGRPVQITRDLESFWKRTYPDVRKELRGRYPKHPWPEDPLTAPPTHRTVRRRG